MCSGGILRGELMALFPTDGTELTRSRRARDLRVSRGQLYALGVAVLLFTGVGFSMGFAVGQRQVPEPVEPSVGFLGEVPDDRLVELLARVEASADPASGMHRLTFPDALKEQDALGYQIPLENDPADVIPVTIAPPPEIDGP
jgi:hypothetical protein